MTNPHNLPSFSMSLYKTLTTHGVVDAGISLLKNTLSRDPDWARKTQVDMQGLLSEDMRKTLPDSLPFAQAVVVKVQEIPDCCHETLANELLSADPEAFSLKDKNGQWIAFQMIMLKERRGGFFLDQSKHDAWFARVINSLPDEAFPGDEALNAWKRVIAKGIPNGLTQGAFMKKGSHFQIEGCDENGVPYLKNAKDKKAWTEFLKQGGDPYQLNNGKPLWQSLLPKRSHTVFETDSFEEAVEQWVRKQSRLPGADPAMKTFLEKNARSRLKNSDIVFKSAQQRKEILEQVPHGDGLFMKSGDNAYFWEHFFTLKSGADIAFWSTAVKANRQWMARLHEDPILEAMMAGVWMMNGKEENAINLQRVKNTLNTEEFEERKNSLTYTWTPEQKENLERGLLHIRLDQTLKTDMQNRRHRL